MEQAGYLVLAKRAREIVDESWEEKAFAEDAAGLLGGCVWPPRSYSCSFCRREFRSAQALGGHMNVHRRDRAKLKQFSTPISDHAIVNPRLTDCYRDQSNNPRKKQDCCFDFRNPNPGLNPFVTPLHQKIVVPTSHFLPSFELSSEKYPFSTSTLNDSQKNVKSCLPIIKVCKDNNQSTEEIEDEDAPKRRKKRKCDVVEEETSEVNGLKTCSSVQELDLELRLGNPPKTC